MRFLLVLLSSPHVYGYCVSVVIGVQTASVMLPLPSPSGPSSRRLSDFTPHLARSSATRLSRALLSIPGLSIATLMSEMSRGRASGKIPSVR